MDTLANIVLPANTWVDIYAASGVTVGVQINVENLGSQVVYLNAGAAQPTDQAAFRAVRPGSEKLNDTGDAGAWAFSPVESGLINVKEVV